MKYILILQLLINIIYFLLIILLLKKENVHLHVNFDEEIIETSIKKLENEILYGTAKQQKQPIGIVEELKAVPDSCIKQCVECRKENWLDDC